MNILYKSIFLVIVIFFISCKGNNTNQNPNLVKIGYLSTVTGQAQVVQVLKNTDILNNNSLKAEYLEFSSGPPLVEAALAGKIDVITAGHLPIPNLIAKSNLQWKVVFRNARIRNGILIPYNSPINSLNDIKEGLIGLPIGSVSEMFFKDSISDELLKSNKLKIVQLGSEEILEIINYKGDKDWGEYKAVAIWDPMIAVLKEKKLVKVISLEAGTTYTAFSKELLINRKDTSERFKKAWKEAWAYYLNNIEQVDQLYIKNSLITLNNDILIKIFNFDSRFQKMITSGILDLSLDQDEREKLVFGAKFLYKNNRISEELKLNDLVE